MLKTSQLAVLVLCGGTGRRVGGADKPLLPYRGRPLLETVLSRLPAAQQTLLSANRNLARYARFGLRVVSDCVPGRGPLAGIASAATLLEQNIKWLYVVPGDAPGLPQGLCAALHAAAASHSHSTAYARAERAHYLPLLANRAALNRLARSPDGAVRDWLQGQRGDAESERSGTQSAVLAWPDERAFRNLNTEADFAV
ncbi:MAG: molybdenum cofactor guanylyltransferase [Pseudomonadota bacterium]